MRNCSFLYPLPIAKLGNSSKLQFFKNISPFNIQDRQLIHLKSFLAVTGQNQISVQVQKILKVPLNGGEAWRLTFYTNFKFLLIFNVIPGGGAVLEG